MLIKTIASIAIALPLVVPVQAIAGNVHQISSTSAASSVTATASDHKKLKKLLRQHVWYGDGVSRGGSRGCR